MENQVKQEAMQEVKEVKQETKRTMIDDARELAEVLRKLQTEGLELLKREEELIARREFLKDLGGNSPAGKGKEEKKELTSQELAELTLNGQFNPLQ